MTTTTRTVPDDEVPLLGDQQVPSPGRIPERESEVTTPADPSNWGGRTPSVDGRTNANRRSRSPSDVVERTPLPWPQLSIALLVLLAGNLTINVISPFTPELIRSLDVAKNEAEVDYYVGIMQSLFFAAQTCTTLQWARLSDYIGRKPVILIGVFSLSVSTYSFALSKTFWGFALSRALGGALDSNLAVIRSIIAELTDHTNLALAYSYQPIVSSIGTVLGPLIGGELSRPAERFPNLFGNNRFLKEYPYFLPCAIPATFAAVVCVVAFFFQKETHPSPKSVREFLRGETKKAASEEDPLLPREAPSQGGPEAPVPLRDLLKRDVIIASANYAYISLVEISFRTLNSEFLATPIALGGLGLDPPVIGMIMSSLGAGVGVFNMFIYSRMVARFGVKCMYLVGLTAAVPCFSLFPIINYLARSSIQVSGGLGVGVRVAVGLQGIMVVLMNSCYASIFIFIAAAAPNKASMGATNGFAQSLVCVVRAAGPILASMMYSLSIDEDHHYMGGWLVYYVTVALSFGAIWVGSLLPKHPWKDMN